MLYIGDTVKVIGTTRCGIEDEYECIKIGTICEVVDVDYDSPSGLTVAIVPKNELPYDGYSEYWYREKDVQKGHLEWVVEDNKETELER